jgi:hypothetical protein
MHVIFSISDPSIFLMNLEDKKKRKPRDLFLIFSGVALA